MIAKTAEYLRISHDLIKEGVRLKLEDYVIYNEMLYLESRLYISDSLELKIRIVKYIYEAFFGGHVGRFFIYNRLSSYYY